MKMKNISNYRLAIINEGRLYFGEVSLKIQLSKHLNTHKIIEEYSGEGYLSQGLSESICKVGYQDWKKGVRIGIEYALSMVCNNDNYEITIVSARGLSTDTNPIILSYTSSRALLKMIKHNESKAQHQEFKKIMMHSWNFSANTQIDLDQLS